MNAFPINIGGAEITRWKNLMTEGTGFWVAALVYGYCRAGRAALWREGQIQQILTKATLGKLYRCLSLHIWYIMLALQEM